MLTRILLTLLTCASICFAAKPNDHVDESTGIRFPETIADLKFQNDHRYKEPGLGYSLRYSSTSIRADIYIYDSGVDKIPEGIKNDAVRNEFPVIGGGIREMERRGNYKDVKEISREDVFKAGQIEFLSCKYEFSEPNPASQGWKRSKSFGFITGFHNQFVKVRITYDKAKRKDGDKLVESFTQEVGELIKKARSAPTTAPSI